jgi:hypothetical protein
MEGSLMRGLRIAALLSAGIAAVSVSVASVRPRRPARGAEVEGVTEGGFIPELGEFTIWPPPPAAR